MGVSLVRSLQSELKWSGMGEFSSDDHYIYYCGQESLRRNGVAIMAEYTVFASAQETFASKD